VTALEFPENEEVLHWVWAEQHFRTEDLRTSDGAALVVEFPGWANRGAGPDFREARLRIQEVSGEWATHVGAVELHLRSSGWTAHGHQHNPDYNGVVLHVVLYRDREALATREDGLAIPEAELAPLLWEEPMPPHKEAKARMQKIAALPGRCGAVGDSAGLRQVVEHAAERRLLIKAKALQERWDEGDPEELLFQRMFRALGYSVHAQSFEELAKLYPLRELLSHLRQPVRSARALVLSAGSEPVACSTPSSFRAIPRSAGNSSSGSPSGPPCPSKSAWPPACGSPLVRKTRPTAACWRCSIICDTPRLPGSVPHG